MRGPLARRLMAAPVVLVLAAGVVFALPGLTGVDPGRAVLDARVVGASPDPATLARLNRDLGTDESAPRRFASFLGEVVRGDLGRSFVTRQPVLPETIRAVGVSMSLVAAAMGVALVVALALGLALAHWAGSTFDRLVRGLTRTLVAVPEYVIGPLLVLTFGISLGVLPTSGWATARHVILPALTLAVFPIGVLTQVVRAEALDLLGEPHVRVARAVGLGPMRILFDRVGRLSLVSAVALGSALSASMLSGAVVVEVVFAVPGLGRLLRDAVVDSDLPMLQAGLLAVSSLALLIGILADAIHTALDPRVGLA